MINICFGMKSISSKSSLSKIPVHVFECFTLQLQLAKIVFVIFVNLYSFEAEGKKTNSISNMNDFGISVYKILFNYHHFRKKFFVCFVKKNFKVKMKYAMSYNNLQASNERLAAVTI
jgi:hypothetical protein